MHDTPRDTPDEYEQVADQVSEGKADGDVTEPLGGALSGEQDYVAVNPGGVSGERHVPKGDEEVGKGSEYDPSEERYPSEERGD